MVALNTWPSKYENASWEVDKQLSDAFSQKIDNYLLWKTVEQQLAIINLFWIFYRERMGNWGYSTNTGISAYDNAEWYKQSIIRIEAFFKDLVVIDYKEIFINAIVGKYCAILATLPSTHPQDHTHLSTTDYSA